MKTVAILGASGYAGGELIRLVDGHPALHAVHLGGRSSAGKRLGDVHPQLGSGARQIGTNDVDDLPEVDIAFLALPHGASWEPALALLERGAAVIDLGSDFRLDHPDRYLEAYGASHPAPEQLGSWAFGIPELFHKEIAESDRVAVPGCYPTSAVLPLAPAAGAGLLDLTGIVVDSMSGVSGAGRGAIDFGTVDQSVKAYKVLNHRHRPEMERALDAVTGGSSQLIFTPHLVPMQRGILSTIYARVSAGAGFTDVVDTVTAAYAASPFVHVTERDPETRWVVGSNNCLMSLHFDERSDTVVMLSALDNLLKGAAGQAVQCANVMLGLDEATGLPVEGWMP
jgi:N-acetyl-gamma-glutamyl-phosphate reductase